MVIFFSIDYIMIVLCFLLYVFSNNYCFHITISSNTHFYLTENNTNNIIYTRSYQRLIHCFLNTIKHFLFSADGREQASTSVGSTVVLSSPGTTTLIGK
jgi:hypothetical protein